MGFEAAQVGLDRWRRYYNHDLQLSIAFAGHVWFSRYRLAEAH